MELFFLTIIGLIPLIIGFATLLLFKQSKFSYALFAFLAFASVWQLDVAVLYASPFLELSTIDFFFRLFRFGSIMLTPTLFLVAYVIFQEELPQLKKSKWKFVMNKYVLFIMYSLSILVYLSGFSQNGIHHLEVISYEGFRDFLFPVYGDWQIIYHSNVILFSFCIFVSLKLTIQIANKNIRYFLLSFLITTIIGYIIGIFNMFPRSLLLPSGVSALLFAITVLILVTNMHSRIVKEMNAKLEHQRKFLKKVIDVNPNYIYAKDQEGKYTLVNNSYANLFGVTTDDLLKKTDLLTPSIASEKEDALLINSATDKFIPEEFFFDKDNQKRWIQTYKIPVNTSEHKVLLSVSTDITDLKNQEEKVKYQAYHDDLTGLSNRRLFHETLDKKIKKALENNVRLNVIFLDLDRFKYINDSLSHDIGDLLLIEVGKKLEQVTQSFANKDYSVYRIGGDEFTFILMDATDKEVKSFCEEVLKSFHVSFKVQDHYLFITPSIGISSFPKDGTTSKALIKNADTAMYYVKDKGKNGYQMFLPEMNHNFYRKMIIEKELRSALENNEFEIVYQPQLSIRDNKITGMEALLRWSNKELGNVTPDEFIPVAEETGLILQIGEWVLKTACAQNKKWQNEGYDPLIMAVNISTKQFIEATFVSMIENTLKETELEPKYLELEITESIAMTNQNTAVEKLQQLKTLGIYISIDDFGTGYSSLSYLKKYTIDKLKIDRSFIKDISSNKENYAIVKSIISIAENLDFEVVAEGIENKEELKLLDLLNCGLAQGYFISHPLSNKNLEENVLKATFNTN